MRDNMITGRRAVRAIFWIHVHRQYCEGDKTGIETPLTSRLSARHPLLFQFDSPLAINEMTTN